MAPVVPSPLQIASPLAFSYKNSNKDTLPSYDGPLDNQQDAVLMGIELMRRRIRAAEDDAYRLNQNNTRKDRPPNVRTTSNPKTDTFLKIHRYSSPM
jgi:outer membrane murein-binding lipoprotein Lpp